MLQLEKGAQRSSFRAEADSAEGSAGQGGEASAEGGSELRFLGEFDHYYPPTKALYAPSAFAASGIDAGDDLILTSGDYLRLWRIRDVAEQGNNQSTFISGADPAAAPAADTVPNGDAATGTAPPAAPPARVKRVQEREVCTLKHPTKSAGTAGSTGAASASVSYFCAPLTAFDWNVDSPSKVVAASIDSTVTLWDIERRDLSIQIQAHDKDIYDVAFAEGKNIFASASADGSVRVFDLRVLENCTIVYESPDNSSMLRVAWNKLDPTYMALVAEASSNVCIVDLRYPSVPVGTLSNQHTGRVNSIAWNPHSSGHLLSVGEDCKAVIWHVALATTSAGASISGSPSTLSYVARHPINGAAWATDDDHLIAISCGPFVQLLHV